MKESVHFIPAPPDATLDLEAILADSPTEPSSDNADGLRSMYTFMTEIGDLTTEPIDMSVFGPPTEGYAQVESPMKRAMEMMNSGPLNAGQPVSDERDDDR